MISSARAGGQIPILATLILVPVLLFGARKPPTDLRSLSCVLLKLRDLEGGCL